MRTVDPDSEEARRRREALNDVDRGGSRPRRYAVACVVPLLTLAALAITAPELATSYVAFVLFLIALPFVLTVAVGVLTDGDVVPNPFVLHPIASVALATFAFLAFAVLAPGLMAQIGGMAIGIVVTEIIALGIVAWIAGLFT